MARVLEEVWMKGKEGSRGKMISQELLKTVADAEAVAAAEVLKLVELNKQFREKGFICNKCGSSEHWKNHT